MKKKETRYREVKSLDLPQVDREVLSFWEENNVFDKSISMRENKPVFVFYEGPPSANGLPGIHHVMARAIKDLFCRYKTLKGFQVHRKGGWDTHGLPVELGVEKSLGITKEDIGKKISVEDYNKACRKDVMKYKDTWDELTRIMGFWIDLDDPYITFDRNYIESLWALLKRLFDKGLLYKGHTIQPFSPAAGTGLSSHELNLPGSYRMVKDTSVIAQFKVCNTENDYFLAWTTTPWTLPSNTALAVGHKIDYLKIRTFNPYTFKAVNLIIAKALYQNYFNEKAGFIEAGDEDFEKYNPGDKPIPFKILEEFKGVDLVGKHYEQLLPYVQPEDGDAFRVIKGDFVTTEDGTGIVHIAPSFGADDLKVAKENGIGTLTLVDKQGKFIDEVTDFAGRYVKDYKDQEGYEPVDIDIVVKLKQENKAFKIEKFEHSYPHCWRTDKPIIYYPLDSWFVKTTAYKERMAELNKTINWKPGFTGTGRFGNWLENLVDWNLSRSRFWGTPLPVWVEQGVEEPEIKCIGSFEELKSEVEKAVKTGYMKQSLVPDFDPHKPYVDEIILVSKHGKKMFREKDLIDVWFDSGAMPYAQWHYPLENEEQFRENFPADFIAEGVDQTRGWFFTLHALAVMLFDSVAFKNVVSNGLVLDKKGNKMSKRLGNAADPFETITKYGADATRWYMMSNAQPWDNLKFDTGGIEEVKRKFFGTLFNTYSFFALYANIDGFKYEESDIANSKRPEIDRWIISLLNTLVKEVDAFYDDYEPTKAARAIQSFVIDHLSNWYVRLCRRRFWKGSYSEDKISAYQTLYHCLETLSILISPIAPMYSDELFRNLNNVANRHDAISVHLAYFPEADSQNIDKDLEERMQLAQTFSSMVLSLRKKVNIKVRQPLGKVMIPVLDQHFKEQVKKVEELILAEVNVKTMEYVDDTAGIIVKKAKPDFRQLGKKLGPKMKFLTGALSQFDQNDIARLEQDGYFDFDLDGEIVRINKEELDITSEDIPGWLVATDGPLTVALDIHISEDLGKEGIAREFVNKVQRLRKEMDFNITDRIIVEIESNKAVENAIKEFKNYICTEILAEQLLLKEKVANGNQIEINEVSVKINLKNA
jgi:isoleucyl-tRNA synthetase